MNTVKILKQHDNKALVRVTIDDDFVADQVIFMPDDPATYDDFLKKYGDDYETGRQAALDAF